VELNDQLHISRHSLRRGLLDEFFNHDQTTYPACIGRPYCFYNSQLQSCVISKRLCSLCQLSVV